MARLVEGADGRGPSDKPTERDIESPTRDLPFVFELRDGHEKSAMSGIWHWFLNFTGTHIPSTGSEWYNFWSGFGSDIGEVVIIGGVWSLFRKHNCHVKGCWRIGKHPVDGTPYIVCATHHPDVPEGGVTAEQMAKLGTPRAVNTA